MTCNIKNIIKYFFLFCQCGNSNDNNFNKNHDTIIEYLKENGAPDFILNIYKKYADDDVKKIGNIIWPEKRNGNKFQFKDGLIQEKNNDEILNIYNINGNDLKILCKYYKNKIKVNVQYKDIKDEVIIDTHFSCIHKGINNDTLLKILHLLSTDENRIKKISSDFKIGSKGKYIDGNNDFKNDFNRIKTLLDAIAAKSCIQHEDKFFLFLPQYLEPISNPLMSLKRFTGTEFNKLVIGRERINFPSNDLAINQLNEVIYNHKKSDEQKEKYVENFMKKYQYKNVELIGFIFTKHAGTYIFFPNIQKILFIDSNNFFDYLNEHDEQNTIYISSSDLLRKQNGLNCFTCATLNICLLSEYLSKDNNHEKLESIMKNSSQKNKSELVKFMKDMFNTKNEILKKCVDLNYDKLS